MNDFAGADIAPAGRQGSQFADHLALTYGRTNAKRVRDLSRRGSFPSQYGGSNS